MHCTSWTGSSLLHVYPTTYASIYRVYRLYVRIGAQDSMLYIFCRGIESQGLKHEYGKRRLSRDLMVSKDMLSLKSREGRFSFFFWSTS